MIRKFTAETEDANLDASRIPPAWRPGRHPLSNPYVRKALDIDGQVA